jgi:hypothetical protein
MLPHLIQIVDNSKIINALLVQQELSLMLSENALLQILFVKSLILLVENVNNVILVFL